MLSPWKKSYDQPREHIKRQITLPTKVHLVKAMVFPVVMYGCESWTIKKAEHRRIDAFELWYWRRLLRVPCTARRSNQSILKEINLGWSLEGLMLKLKLQYFGHLMQRAGSLEKTVMLGKIEGRRRRGRQRMRWLGGITNLMDMALGHSGSWWWTERPGVWLFMGSQRVEHKWVTELNWQLVHQLQVWPKISFIMEGIYILKSSCIEAKPGLFLHLLPTSICLQLYSHECSIKLVSFCEKMKLETTVTEVSLKLYKMIEERDFICKE